MLIVISTPSVKNDYYKKVFEQIVEFQINLVNAIIERDNIIVLADKATMPYLKSKLPDDVFLEANVEDIWIRDFAPVNPYNPIQFKYAPSYFENINDAYYIQSSFNSFALKYGVNYAKSDLILDGGNFVDNYNNRVIITRKFLEDNSLREIEAIQKLKELIGINEIAIIPYDEEKIGHSDGMVMFATENKLIINKYNEPLRSEIIKALKKNLTNIEITEVGADFDTSLWKGFTSACGIYVNSLVTNDFIYVPVYGTKTDELAVEVIKKNINKKVITINAKNICFMGGSVRCLTWQVAGKNAKRLIESARNK